MLIAAGMVALTILSIDEPPPDVADLEVHRASMADEENGYTYLREAGKVLWWPGYDSGVARADTGLPDEPLPDKDPAETEKAELLDRIVAGEVWDDALVDDVLAHNAETFALIEKALACPHFQIRLPSVLSIDTAVPEIVDWYFLPKVQVIRALALFQRAREKQAFGEALRIVRIGHAIEGGQGGLVHYRVGRDAKALGLRTMRHILAATVLNAQELIAWAEELAPHTANEHGLADAFRMEYAWTVVVLEQLKAGKVCIRGRQLEILDTGNNGSRAQPFFPERAAFLWHFRLNRTKRLCADRLRTLIANCDANYARIERLERPADLPRPLHFLRPSNAAGKMVFFMLMPPLDFMGCLKCEESAEVAAMRVLLAMKAFKVDKGRLPGTLEELVPEYIDAVPLDDFDGKPMRYNSEKRVIYSVGEDFKDDGGMTKEEQEVWWKDEDPWRAEEGDEPDVWRMPDPSWMIEF